jgi:hypothetical protein
MIPTPEEFTGSSDLVEHVSSYLRQNKVMAVLMALTSISSITCIYLFGVASDLKAQSTKQKASISEISSELDKAKNEIVNFDAVANRLDNVVDCVNEYMDVVGDSGGYSYMYYHCR